MRFWSPQLRKNIAAIERVQRRATRLIPGLARLSYEERLKETGLYTLERRGLRGDMTEMFKVMKGRDKICEDELFSRGDSDSVARPLRARPLDGAASRLDRSPGIQIVAPDKSGVDVSSIGPKFANG